MGNNWSPRLAIYGDMGYVNAHSLNSLRDDVQRGLYDAILHIGDIGYDLDTVLTICLIINGRLKLFSCFQDNGRVGDNFMGKIEAIAANVPYQVCPGNHEHR